MLVLSLGHISACQCCTGSSFGADPCQHPNSASKPRIGTWERNASIASTSASQAMNCISKSDGKAKYVSSSSCRAPTDFSATPGGNGTCQEAASSTAKVRFEAFCKESSSIEASRYWCSVSFSSKMMPPKLARPFHLENSKPLWPRPPSKRFQKLEILQKFPKNT